MAQKFYRENFDKWGTHKTLIANSDELIVGFMGEALRGKVSRENFDKSLAIRQIHQSFPPSNYCTTVYVQIFEGRKFCCFRGQLVIHEI